MNFLKKKGIKRYDTPIRDLWDTTTYIFKGLVYYYSLLVDFLFGNVTDVIMYNLLKVTIVFLTIVSFYTTFIGLSVHFYDPWTALFITIGVQGTLMALSLYVPIHQSKINLKGYKGLDRLFKEVKKYVIWLPLICCLAVSSFFSYVALSQRVYSQVEYINNEYKSKEIFNEILVGTNETVHEQIRITENNITNIVEYLQNKIASVDLEEIDLGDIENRINELGLKLAQEQTQYNRSLENYDRYQEAVSSTVDPDKRQINTDKANEELEYIKEYELAKLEYDGLVNSGTSQAKYLPGSKQALYHKVNSIVEGINKFNLHGIDLPYEDLDTLTQELSLNLDNLGILDMNIQYLQELLEHKIDLTSYLKDLTKNKKDIMESADLDKIKNLVYDSPLDRTILAPEVLESNIDIKSLDVFSLLTGVYTFERLTHEGVNQIEKSIGYLTDNNFPFLAYIALMMAVFVDALVLIQGFSVTKSISRTEDMTDKDKQEFINWLLRKKYSERDPGTGKIIRMKTIDKLLTYCVPNENCTKIYVDVESIRTNPEMSMTVNILNQLGYLMENEDDYLILDPDLMVLYLQRTSLMVDTEYYHLKGEYK